MKYFKTFESWVSEEFAAVGVPPEGNVAGMGAVIPPSNTNNGSGDSWGSKYERLKRKKKKYRKIKK